MRGLSGLLRGIRGFALSAQAGDKFLRQPAGELRHQALFDHGMKLLRFAFGLEAHYFQCSTIPEGASEEGGCRKQPSSLRLPW